VSSLENSAIRVVIADDHKLIREGLKAIFEREKKIAVVGEARDGEEAVVAARMLKPDVILMDIEMPGTDGIVATRLIREINSDVKVIILSNYENHDRIWAAMKAHARGYVVKRAGGKDLVEIIEAVQQGEMIVSPYLANLALQSEEFQSAEDCPPQFTERERQILKLLVAGYCNKEISNSIFISVDTVKAHLKHIFEKLDVDCRTKAAVEALKRKIVVV
jgi:DNA-binding NarL/FixJ family response regulator